MELIQEFAENQSLLNALSGFQDCKFNFGFASEDATKQSSAREKSILSILKEPLGRLCLRYHAIADGCSELLFFLDVLNEYQQLPPGSYRKRVAHKIISKFITLDSSMPISLCDVVRNDLESRFAKDGDCDDLFEGARRSVIRDLQFHVFHRFLDSEYYRKLVTIREMELKPVTRESFDFIRVLGMGGFGKVYAVSKRDTKAVYACKVMDKQKIVERRRQKLLMNERDILAQVSHPYLLNLKYAFQDRANLFFVLDIVTGGDLQFHLNRLNGGFQKSWAQFFAAGIFLAVEYLHSLNIVYRDLKPENVLLDADGYVRLADLGLCYKMKKGENLTQHCGTRSYMAPEQSFGDKGYGLEVDWWSFGVIVLNLLTDKNPFHRSRRNECQRVRKSTKSNKRSGSAQSLKKSRRSGSRRSGSNQIQNPSKRKSEKPIRQSVWQTIRQKVKDDSSIHETDEKEEREEREKELLQFFEDEIKALPTNLKSLDEDAQEFLKQILTIDISKRLGTKSSDEIRNHPFFKSTNWEKMESRHYVAPFVPSQRAVNAEYVGAADDGFDKSSVIKHFENFDYVAPTVFQDEVIATVHDKHDLMVSS